MKPLRFILLFLLSYSVATGTSFFFVVAMQVLRDPRILFFPFLLSVVVTFLCSAAYFKGVPHAGWRARLEVVGVWLGLTLLLDGVLLYFVLERAVGDLSLVSLIGYTLQLATLLVAAYITKRAAPPVASPDLSIKM